MSKLHKLFIKEKGLKKDYRKWLETKIVDESGALYTEPEIGENAKVTPTFTIAKRPKNYETEIEYDDPTLNYQVRVDFPRMLEINERERIEGIINYWSALPFVSVEGNYGIQWYQSGNTQVVYIEIDFTKSASDDYAGREILEKLAEWIWKGTPIRKRTKDQKWEGVIKPTRVSADCP